MMRRVVLGVGLGVSVAAMISCGREVPRLEPASGDSGPDAFSTPPVDHHVHVLSPRLVADWKSLGVPFGRPDSAYTSVTAMLGTEAARQAFLVSMAHIYGSDEFRAALTLDEESEHGAVREANDHVAREALRAPARFVAFCSVHPGRPYAMEEIRRCRRELGMAGLKIHLPNAGLDLGDGETLDLLGGLAADADAEGVALLIHLASPEEELTGREVARFIDVVVRPHPRLELYLAHMGGGGGYRGPARTVVREFLAFLARDPTERTIFFELSGAMLVDETDGVPPSTPEEMARLGADIRALGTERVVFGSDYPVFDPAAQAAAVRSRLGLSEAEAAAVLGNSGPSLRARPQRPPEAM